MPVSSQLLADDKAARLKAAIEKGRKAVEVALAFQAEGVGTQIASAGKTPTAALPQPVQDERACVQTRLRWVLLVMSLVFALLMGRVFTLQVVQADDYARQWSQSQITEDVPAVRGAITDRRGEVYAITQLSGKSLFAVPKLLGADQRGQLARLVATALGQAPEALAAKFEAFRDKSFMWIKRRLSDEEIAAVALLVKHEPALAFRDEMERLYPQGRILANALGFVSTDGHGLEGVERYHDALLAGTDGQRTVLRDARGHRIQVESASSIDPRHGATLMLTIDHIIQCVVEDELDKIVADWAPKSVSALVMDPNTGEVLAIASRPTVDPRNRRAASADVWRNRPITDVYEPGSIFKPCVMLAALEEHKFRLPAPGAPIPKDPLQPMPGESTINCENGAWLMTCPTHKARRTLHDAHRYGVLPLAGVIIKSSNIGMCKVGLSLGSDLLLDYLRRFGYGSKLGIDLPGEAPGLFPPKEKCPELFTVPSVSMGQAIGVTALQVLTAFNQCANGGYILRPVVVKRAVDASGTVVYEPHLPHVLARPLTDAAARAWMTQTLVRVCQKGGTAAVANLDDFGITVAGKTGTANKIPGNSTKLICSFLAFAPAEQPRISVLVTVDEPTKSNGREFYGGTVAAPAVRNIVLRGLRQLGHGAGNR